MRYPIQILQQLCGARASYLNEAGVITEILYDSRRMRKVEGVLFVAIEGKHHNGHDYIKELIEKGIGHFLVTYIPENLESKANFLVVDDTLSAFQLLARKIRENSNAHVIGVTGSNGKTIIKEWLAQVLKSTFQVTKNPKSYNSQLGVPLSLCRLEKDDDYGVFEAGISEPGEMEALANIIQPQLGIFANIGSAHQEHFSNRRQKIQEKLKLFTGAKQLVFCADHEEIHSEVYAVSPSYEIWDWSFTLEKARVLVVERHGKFTLSWGERQAVLSLSFADAASVENALHIAVSILALGLSPEVFFPYLSKLEHISMRLEMKKGRAQTLLVNDAYSNDLESLKMALEYFVQQTAQRKRVLILSDIEQSGLSEAVLYQEVSDLLKNYPIDQLIVVGEGAKRLKKSMSSVQHFPNTQALLANLPVEALSGKAILLKGARSFAFEQIDRWLEEKSHETILEVNLARMVQNLNFYRSKLTPGVKTMVMVKAFGYGAGSVELASLLQFHKVDYLAVAYADEGVALRKAGIELPIMVLNTEIAALEDMVEYNLEPEVYSFRILRALEQTVQRLGLDKPMRIHLKVETGMHRLGFETHQLASLIEALQANKQLKVQSVFSHLAAADDPMERDFTLSQIQQFEAHCSQLEAGLGYSFDRHLANSSGISAYPQAQFEMVRLGIGLYGVSAYPEEVEFLKPISSLKATVSQIKHLRKGESLGYGRSYCAPEDQTIATISIGYADGFRRSLSNGVGEVAIRGKRYPVVGRVCMDMCMLNISGGLVAEGDEAEIFGSTISLYELAEKMNTIPYEVLTSISERVKRVYLME
jgi:alanine racemase